MRLACADDTLADYSASLEALKQKHPPSHPDSAIGPTPDGSAGGPDGLRPQHLRDFAGPTARE